MGDRVGSAGRVGCDAHGCGPGADLEEAVKIACAIDPYCSGPKTVEALAG